MTQENKAIARRVYEIVSTGELERAGEFEEAYRLCPKGHAPRYCMGSSSGHPCPRPATVRCGSGYYCEEHSVAIHEGRDVDDPCEAI
jgi:hypothetical protein